MLLGFLEEGAGVRGVLAVRDAARAIAPEFADGDFECLRFGGFQIWRRNSFSDHAAFLSFHWTVLEKGSFCDPCSISWRPCCSTPYSGRNVNGRVVTLMA